jgi:hypothetical protein
MTRTRILLTILVVASINLAYQFAWLRGFEAAYIEIECVDVTDPNQFVGDHHHGRPPASFVSGTGSFSSSQVSGDGLRLNGHRP